MRGRLILALIATAALAAGLAVSEFRARRAESKLQARAASSPDLSASERAVAIREFLRLHGSAVDRKVDEALRGDLGYRPALMSITESSVRAQAGLSEEEKTELWRAVSRAQQRARDAR
jgi:hypothetical protein